MFPILLALLGILFGVDFLILKKLTSLSMEVAKSIGTLYESRMIEFLYHAVLAGTYSISIALGVLEDLARESKVAEKMIDYINNKILGGPDIVKASEQSYEFDFIDRMIKPTADIVDLEFLADMLSHELERGASMLEAITTGISETLSAVLFMAFFAPMVIMEIALLFGVFGLLTTIPVSQIGLTYYLIKNVRGIKHQITTSFGPVIV